MAKPPTIYDLVLVLSVSVEDTARAKVLTDVESVIEGAGGKVERKQEWGTRPMTFEIRHQGEGEYHLYQFAGPPALLDTLSHNLRIDDTVLRFRIIKVLPGTPPAPDSPPPVLVAAAGGAPTGIDPEV
jgi:small subunit ribosomal protein S6